jgi:proteasome assembly chaperone 4
MASEGSIKSQVKILDSSDPSLPPLALQITQLVDTYMLWIGAVDTNVEGAEEKAVLNGSLCKDWACAMPPRAVGF